MEARWAYLGNEVWVGLRRNLLMTIATMLTVTVTLAMVGAGLLVQRQVELAQEVLYADVEVSIFLSEEITPAQRVALEQELNATPVVAGVLYESREQAYENARKLFADDPLILDDIRPEILPESFRVRLTDPEEFSVISSLFAGRPGIDEIIDQRDLLEDFFAVMGKLRQFSLIVAVLVALAAIALIATTIRLTAYARREQTGIMKLVGATNWYIRLPFVLEGMTATTVGAFAAFGLLLLGERVYVPGLRQTIEFLPFIDSTDVFAIFPALFLGSLVVGALVSILSLRRFLAV